MNNTEHRISYFIKSIIYIFAMCFLFFLVVMFTDSGYAPGVILATVLLLVRVVKKYISVVKEEVQLERKIKLSSYDSIDDKTIHTNTYTYSQDEVKSEVKEVLQQENRDYKIGRTDESYSAKPEKDPWDL